MRHSFIVYNNSDYAIACGMSLQNGSSVSTSASQDMMDLDGLLGAAMSPGPQDTASAAVATSSADVEGILNSAGPAASMSTQVDLAKHPSGIIPTLQ